MIAKNVIGWLLILASWALGIISPIPIGFFLFLVGFGLIWFPGKRGMTARFLRGTPVQASSRAFKVSLALAAVIVPTLLVLWLNKLLHLPYRLTAYTGLVFGSLYFARRRGDAFFRHANPHMFNRLLQLMPKARAGARPWLRARGIDLLPPRRRTRRVQPEGR